MRLLFLILLLSALSGTPVAAQVAEEPKQSAAAVSYYDKQGRKIASAEGASYYEKVTYTDSLGGNITSYYPSGKVKEVRSYADIRRLIGQGTHTEWYESGQMRVQQEMVGGMQQGELVSYHPNGAIRCREYYVNSQVERGEYFDVEGKKIKGKQYLCLPGHRGGNEAILREISQNIVYPKNARRENIEGVVLAGFTVSTTGKVENVYIIEGINPAIDAEVIRVIAKLKGFTAGQRDGEPIAFSYTMPVTFRLQE
jgi:TonB family protein